jgi:hypothetical protein
MSRTAATGALTACEACGLQFEDHGSLQEHRAREGCGMAP